jgi:branched-subunit amino acid aminotransferase/4-amino-4-deoxychorismate lyase
VPRKRRTTISTRRLREAACEWSVRANRAFVPPYGSGGAMYLRPYIFGHGPQLGLAPAPEFHFCVLAIPVASYYKSGLQVRCAGRGARRAARERERWSSSSGGAGRSQREEGTRSATAGVVVGADRP